MTDVTGFGLMGHLIEMCEASNASALVELDKVPLLDSEAINYYLSQGCVPGGTNRNFESYGHKIATLTDLQRNILCDPQTSGGLLVAVSASQENTFKKFAAQLGLVLEPIGEVIYEREKRVEVE
jgi:selenide,water dikinase